MKLCPTLCDPTDCNWPVSSIHGTLQTRILEWVAIPFSGDLSNLEIQPRSPALQEDSMMLSTISSSTAPFSLCLQDFPDSLFHWVSALHIRWSKYWSFSFSNRLSNEYSMLISFMIELTWVKTRAVKNDRYLFGCTQVVLVVKNLPANVGDIRDAGSIPGSGRSLGRGHSNPFQYSCLENPTDRGVWCATAHRVTKSQTWLKQLKHTHSLQ